jgi:hypothetical protein
MDSSFNNFARMGTKTEKKALGENASADDNTCLLSAETSARLVSNGSG